nr:golgin candidate 5 [Tanacetum cinerariifolium]
MDLVISLMRQVESEEKAAGQARAEAAIGGLDIRLKVEELKQAQQHAKETNETHAKEVSL